MKFKLNAVASVILLGTLLGCAPLMPGAPLAGSAVAPARGQGGTVPVKVAQAPAITLATSSSDALYTLGLTAHGSGQIALASHRYTQALKIKPDHLGALNGLAVIYAQSGRTDDALKLFAYAIELAPASAHIRNNAGYALLRADRLEEADAALTKARELDPANVQTLQNLALLASAKAVRQPAEQAIQADAGDSDGPRLVAVAPSVYELQAPTGFTTAATAEAQTEPATPAQAQVVDATGEVPSPGPDIRLEAMPRMATMAASADLRGVRLEVSNGVGISRLARRTAERLATEGVKTTRLTNALPYRQARTEIQYVAGQAQAAQALQSCLPVATHTVTADRLQKGVQVRLVLGHDMAGKAITAWLESAEQQQAAATSQGGWRWS